MISLEEYPQVLPKLAPVLYLILIMGVTHCPVVVSGVTFLGTSAYFNSESHEVYDDVLITVFSSVL